MNLDHVIAQLRSSTGARLCPPASEEARGRIDASILPRAHKEFLHRANGATVYHGYQRLFGIGCPECIDLLEWNAAQTWKFAWPMDLSRYLCFAEDAWGYQWAYDLGDLREKGTSAIYWLAAYTMTADREFDDFGQWVEREFVRWLRDPYGSLTVAAHRKHGPLDWAHHIAYVPALILGGKMDDIERTMRMPARQAMVIQGDVYRQAGDESTSRPIKRVEPYTDENGRARLRVEFE